MGIDVDVFIASRRELALHCRGWRAPKRLEPPRKVRYTNPFTKKAATSTQHFELPTKLAPGARSPHFYDAFLHGRTTYRHGFPDPLVELAGALTPSKKAREDELVPVLCGPGGRAVFELPRALAEAVRTEDGRARARAAASACEVDPRFVDSVAEDVGLADVLGRECFVSVEVDGGSESWAELLPLLDRAGSLLAAELRAELTHLASEARPSGLRHHGARDFAARLLECAAFSRHQDVVLGLLARSGVSAPELVEVVAELAETEGGLTERGRASLVRTLPSMIQCLGQIDAHAFAMRVIGALPAERALATALLRREIERERHGAEPSLLLRAWGALNDDRAAADEFLAARVGGRGAIGFAAVEALAHGSSASATPAWLEALSAAPTAERMTALFPKFERAALRSALESALQRETEREHAHALLGGLLHAWFGDRLVDREPSGDELRVLVSEEGLPLSRRVAYASVTGDRIAHWLGPRVVGEVSGGFDDTRFIPVCAPRDAAELGLDERKLLLRLHARAALWDQRTEVFRVYGLPSSRHALGAFLGVPTPARDVRVEAPYLLGALALVPRSDMGDADVDVLRALRDVLERGFAIPVALYPPLGDARARDAGVIELEHVRRGPRPPASGPGMFAVRSGPVVMHRTGRYGSFENGVGAYSLNAIGQGHPRERLLERALRVLVQSALLTVKYPFCPNAGCLLAPTPWIRPRAPDERPDLRNVLFGTPGDLSEVRLGLCSDCLTVAATHRGSSLGEHARMLAGLIERIGLPDDAESMRQRTKLA